MRLRLLTAALVLVATVLRGAPLIFDFGAAKAPLHQGAQRVTASGSEHAAWSAGAALRETTNPVKREWQENSHTRRSTPPLSYQTELSASHISSAQPATLTLAVPSGAYRLLLLCGRAGGSDAQVWDVAVANSDGSLVQATFAGSHELRALYLDCITDTLGITLNLTTRSRWLLNAIVAVPLAEWEQVEGEMLRPLLKEHFVLPAAVLAKWREAPRPCLDPEPAWTDQQRQSGVALYTRPWVEPIWPDHFPRVHELGAPVRAFATPGEYEPLNFALHALRGISNVTMEVGGLTCRAGGTQHEIPGDALDARFVRYAYVRPNYNSFGIYYRAPDVLMPWQPQAIAKGENLRVWLTVKVPVGQPPGIYEGTVLLDADGAKLSVPLTLRVLPFTLQRDRSLVYGMYYRHPLRHSEKAPDAFSRAWWQDKAASEHDDMREHGMNTVVLRLGGDFSKDKWFFSFDSLQRDLDLALGRGFDKPFVCSIPIHSLYAKHMGKPGMGSHLATIRIPPEAFFEELTWMVGFIQAEARRRQWPELLYYPVDEPSTTPDSVEFMRRTMEAIKKVPGVRTYVTADPAHSKFQPMRPFVDIWCCQPFSLGREAILADMRERGVEYWCYPNHISGENDHTPTIGARMTYGFGFWQSGYRCLIPWIYQYSSGDPWNNLDGATADFFNRIADDGAPIPVPFWEAYREGIDDHRYVHTLEIAIERAIAAGRTEDAARARKLLDDIMASIEVQTKYKDERLWPAETFDAWRWAIAQEIIKLRE